MPICISGGAVAAARNRHRNKEQNSKEPYNNYFVAYHIYVLRRVNIIKKEYIGQIETYDPDTHKYTVTDDFSKKKLFNRDEDPWSVRDKLQELYDDRNLIFKLNSCEVREYHWFDEDGNEQITLFHDM